MDALLCRVPIDEPSGAEPPDNGTFRFERSGPGQNRTLEANYTLSGTATNGQDYQQLDGKVVFSPGQTSTLVDVVAVDDESAEWTETVVANLAQTASHMSIAGNGDKAKLDLRDNDTQVILAERVLIVNNDDSDSDDVIDLHDLNGVSGEDGLYPVSLKYPAGDRGNASLTWPGDKLKVWKNSDRTDELVFDAGAGFASLPTNALTQVFVEAVAGSTTVGDLVLLLEATDRVAPTQPLDETPNAPATTQSTTQPSTAAGINLTVNSNPPAGRKDILVGQKALVQTSVVGPAVVTETTYVVSGATFKDYVATDDSATLTNLVEADLKWVAPEGNDPPRANEVGFYWWKGDKAGKNETAKVTERLELAGRGVEVTREVGFVVYSPEAAVEVKVGRVARGRSAEDGPYTYFGLSRTRRDPDSLYGMEHRGTVTLTGPFAHSLPGMWYFTQLIDTANYALINGVLHKTAHTDDGFVLDSSVAYGGADGTFSTGPVSGSIGDSPRNQFLEGWTWTGRDDVFQVYLMFVPAGADSRPVPLLYDEVRWGGAVYKDGNTWEFDPAKPRYWTDPAPTPVPATAHPLWAKNNAVKHFIPA